LENPKKQRQRERRATLQNELQAAREKVSELLAVNQAQSDMICAKDELIAMLENQVLTASPAPGSSSGSPGQV
jgi:hypothetical protein